MTHDIIIDSGAFLLCKEGLMGEEIWYPVVGLVVAFLIGIAANVWFNWDGIKDYVVARLDYLECRWKNRHSPRNKFFY